MNNKKTIYILLPIVAIIWGLLIYQFFNWSSPEEQIIESGFQLATKPLKLELAKAVKIEVNYRDPFLGNFSASTIDKNSTNAAMIAKKAVVKKMKPIKVKEVIAWPVIHFKGIVSDTKGKKQVFMLQIDGKIVLMQPKAIENGVYLVEGDRETIEVKYKGETKLVVIDE